MKTFLLLITLKWLVTYNSLKNLSHLRYSFIRSKLSSHNDYLHVSEYPNDNYNHVLGYGIKDHNMSKLQSISKERIKDLKLLKAPIDAVS